MPSGAATPYPATMPSGVPQHSGAAMPSGAATQSGVRMRSGAQPSGRAMQFGAETQAPSIFHRWQSTENKQSECFDNGKPRESAGRKAKDLSERRKTNYERRTQMYSSFILRPSTFVW